MNGKKNKIIITVFGTILLLILLVFFFPEYHEEKKKDRIGCFDNWVVSSEKSGSIVMKTMLPNEFESFKTLAFWSGLQEVKLVLEGKEIYSSLDGERFGNGPVPRWNYIIIPEKSEGKQLSICIENVYGTSLPEPVDVFYGTRGNIIHWFYEQCFLSILLDILIVALGIWFIVLSLITKSEKRYRIRYSMFGITAILFTIWFSSGRMYPDHWIPAYLISLAFFLLPIVFMAYIRMHIVKKPFLVKAGDILIGADMIAVIAVFLLHGLGIRDLYENSFLGFSFLAAAGFFGLICALYYFIKERELVSILSVTNAVLFMGIVISVYMKISSNSTYSSRMEIITRVIFLLIVLLEMVLFLRQIQTKNRMQKSIEEQNQNLRLHILTSQIRPHFILNTLGAIRSMIRVNPDYASDLLYDFSQYIRKNMDQKDYKKPVPFMEEMNYIDTYLRLEKLRFGDRLKIEKDLQMTEFRILPLTIQPFVENAVKHGLMEKKEGGTLWIRTGREEDHALIIIEDDGVGFDTTDFWKKLKEGNSVGMKSAILRLQYDMDGTCHVESSTKEGESGTVIRIELPLERRIKHENHNRR